MTITTSVVTITASAVQFPAPTAGALITQMFVEPLRSNTHKAYIGLSNVTNDGSGTGVIKELAQPPAATVPCDVWWLQEMGGFNLIDPTKFYVHGTNTESVKVTYLTS